MSQSQYHHRSSHHPSSHHQSQPPPPPLPTAPPAIQSSSSSGNLGGLASSSSSALSSSGAAPAPLSSSTGPLSSYFLRDVPGYSKSLYHCAWSCDGEHLSVICGDKNVHISQFDSRRGVLPSLQPIHTISTNTVMAKTAWHPTEGNRLAICGDEKFVEVWDVRASKAAMKLPSLGNNLNVSWSRDGHMVAVGNRNEYFLVFDVRTGTQMRKKKFSHEMNEMAWSYNNDYLLVAAGVDGMGALDVISVFNSGSSGGGSEELTVVDSLVAHSGACQQLAVDATCRRLAMGGTDKFVSLWSLEDLVCDRFVPLDVNTELRSLCFSPDGQFLAIAAGVTGTAGGADEQGVLIVNSDSAEPVVKIDARMKCTTVAWQPQQATANSPTVLAVVCDDKTATSSSATTTSSAGATVFSSSTTTKDGPVFLRLAVIPPSHS